MRFLSLDQENAVIPDATELWLYCRALACAGALQRLFAEFDGYLYEHGFLAMGGSIIKAPSSQPHDRAIATDPTYRCSRRYSYLTVKSC